MITIEEVVGKIGDWQGRQVSIQPLSGGLTNTNFQVEVDGQPFCAHPERQHWLLGGRPAERVLQLKAPPGRRGARVVLPPEDEVMVLSSSGRRRCPTQPLTSRERRDALLRQLNARREAALLKDFNMFRLTEFYIDIVKHYDVRIPEGYYDRMLAVERIEQAMQVHPLPTVPCNNDLLAENYLDDGQKIWIIDYEYSGNNDPCFELGNTCQELQYDETRIAELCEAYFGRAAPDKLARMKLNMIMSDVGWGLWAAIQAKISKIDYDFWGWATERWDRAVAKFDSAEFPTWLEDVQRVDL
jgi:thiamine kinase-like enzyme